MSTIGLVMAIAVPLALILLAGVFYNRRVQARQVKAHQARVVRQKAADLLESLEFLMQIDDHRILQKTVLERIADMYQRADQMFADSSVGPFDMAPYVAKLDADEPVRKILKSDREMSYGRRQCSNILKALAPMAKTKQITDAEFQEYKRHLRLLLLDREVSTFIHQGDAAATKRDIATAANYYKAARKLLIETDLQFQDKNARVKLIAEKNTALYKDGAEEETPKEDLLSKALAREEESKTNEFGMPSGPESEKKRF